MRILGGTKPYISFSLVMVFVFAFSGVSSADTQAELQKLYEAAKADGRVVLTWPTATQAIEPVVNKFQAKYPDVKLSAVSIAATSLGSRIIIEAGAKKVTVDVGSALLSYLMPVIERDLMVKYDWTKIVDVDPRRVSYDGRLVHFMEVPRVWIYNTNLVSKAAAPKTWEDTLDPKWKDGKITIRAAPSGLASVFPVWKKDKTKAVDYLNRLSKQNVLPGKRDSEVINRVATGECPLGVLGANVVFDALSKGAPLAICPIGPSASDPGAYFIPQGAPHPAAAKLLLAWLASREGTQAVVDTGSGPAYPPEASPMAKLLADNGIAFVPIVSAEDIKEYVGAFAKAVMSTMGFMPEETKP
jgi:iron(III) transport system substrate-binding protein